MKIAIAASGLGHIKRGVETWAEESALALRKLNYEVTLFQGGGESNESWRVVLPNCHRFAPETQRAVRFFRALGGWRYGTGSGYELEQTTFSVNLWRMIRRSYDILHVKDPWVALWLDRLHRAGLSRPRVIISHGTEEPADFLRRYTNLQHMTPPFMDEYAPHRPPGQRNFVLPNFVRTDKFRPGDQAAARESWNLDPADFVVLCVAAIKKTHKRIDYLVREFAQFEAALPHPAVLVVAGATERETPEVIALGLRLLGDRVRFVQNVPRDRMPSLYQAADLFVLTSLVEMFGHVFLEAMATSVPVICSDTPTLRWVIGPGGLIRDLREPGALACALKTMSDPDIRRSYAQAARPHVEANFSEAVVIRKTIDMYQEVLADGR